MMRSVRLLGVALAAAVAVGWAWRTMREPQAFSLQHVATDPAGGGDATFAPDGTRFVTSSRRSGNVDLWMFDLRTGAWTQLTDDPAEDFEGRWSPDGSLIAFTSTRAGTKDIWVLDVRTRSVRRLTTSNDEEEYPVWSPHGEWIAYTGGPWKGRDFFIVPASGGEARQLTRWSGRAGACAFEPSGTSLVCHRYDSGRGQIIRLWLDGEEAPLTGGDGWDYKPVPSPDGRSIAFSRSVEGPSQLWLLSAVGRPTQLVRSAFDDRWPTWDASGHQLLFHRLVDEGRGVFLLDRRTGQRREVVPGTERPRQASLDPSMSLVAYCAQVGDGFVVRVANLVSGDTRTIDTGGRNACFPRWSPSGEALAFVLRGDRRWEIATVDRDGGCLRVLTERHRTLRGLDGVIDWSPDGRQLTFQADTEPFEARLYAIDVGTGVLTALTSPGWFDESPSWAPDGRSLTFMSTRGGDWTWSLFSLSSADGSLRSLVGPDWIEKNFPRLSASGSLIWSSRDSSGVDRLIERGPDGVERPLDAAGTGARWPSYSNDGRWVMWTAVDHRVEYWIVHNPEGRGSSARSTPGVPAPAAVVAPLEVGGRGGEAVSPRDLHRR